MHYSSVDVDAMLFQDSSKELETCDCKNEKEEKQDDQSVSKQGK
jgi:hypothetical protein